LKIHLFYKLSGIKIKHIFFLCVLYTTHVKCQDSSGRYPFINEQINHLYFSNDSGLFMKVFNKMGQLLAKPDNKITVVHMGGSHVQGGTWSNTFISDLQNSFATNGGGYFTFPYKIAKTNGQPYVTSFTNGKWKRCRALSKEFCLPLGMSAMSVNTNDSSNIFGVALTARSVLRKFNLVRVYHNFNGSFDFQLSSKNVALIERDEDQKAGYSLFKLNTPIDSVEFTLLKKDTIQKDFIIYGFSLENDLTPGFYLAGLGANGASSSSFLRCNNLLPQLESLKPDLLILSLGVNDTQSKGFEKEEYIEHYDSLITLARKANPDLAIVLTTTTDNYIKKRTSNKRTVLARDAMFELMQKHKVAVWDLFSIMGGFKSMSKWYKAGLASRDKVHFSAKGYSIVGNLMFEAFMKAYRNNQKK
jgi:lysophospholipase L1-like esterase